MDKEYVFHKISIKQIYIFLLWSSILSMAFFQIIKHSSKILYYNLCKHISNILGFNIWMNIPFGLGPDNYLMLLPKGNVFRQYSIVV